MLEIVVTSKILEPP